MKRYSIAILRSVEAKAPMRRGRRDKSPGGPDAAGAKRTKRPRAARLPPRKDSSGVGRRLRSMPFWTCAAPAAVERHVRRGDLDRDGFVVFEGALAPSQGERLGG